MAPSRLEVSEHAAERIKQRKITRKQIRECLADGVLVGTDINGRKIVHKRIGNRKLVVVFIEVIGGQMIVTAYWEGVFE